MKVQSSISEKYLLAQIIELAQFCHWDLIYHTFEQKNYAKRSAKGFPDLVMGKNLLDGNTVAVFAEIKSERGKLSIPQKEWLEFWDKVRGGVFTFVWIPSQFDEIVEMLQARGLPDIIMVWRKHALFAKSRFGLNLAMQVKGSLAAESV